MNAHILNLYFFFQSKNAKRKWPSFEMNNQAGCPLRYPYMSVAASVYAFVCWSRSHIVIFNISQKENNLCEVRSITPQHNKLLLFSLILQVSCANKRNSLLVCLWSDHVIMYSFLMYQLDLGQQQNWVHTPARINVLFATISIHIQKTHTNTREDTPVKCKCQAASHFVHVFFSSSNEKKYLLLVLSLI